MCPFSGDELPPSKVWIFQNALSVLGLAWQLLVLVPFGVFLLGALVRLLVYLWRISKWPSWTSYALFLPLFLILESLLGLRMTLIDNVVDLWWYLLFPYDFTDIEPYVYSDLPTFQYGAAYYNQEIYAQRTMMKTVFRLKKKFPKKIFG